MAKTIIIDPGHGGDDPGAIGYGLKEKNINLDIARRVKEQLTNYVDIKMTRNSDNFVSLSERANYANEAGADLFLSIHVNAGGGTGFESFVYEDVPEETQRLRETIHKDVASFYEKNGFIDRGMKSANFAVLRETVMSAVLLENLFIDTQQDAEQLEKPKFRQGIAEAIAGGILKAMNIEIPEQPSEPAHWASEEFARLKEAGLVVGEHDLDSNVTWGEFSAVIARLLDKLDM